MGMDSVAIASILAVVASVGVVGFIFYKVSKWINESGEDKQG